MGKKWKGKKLACGREERRIMVPNQDEEEKKKKKKKEWDAGDTKNILQVHEWNHKKDISRKNPMISKLDTIDGRTKPCMPPHVVMAYYL